VRNATEARAVNMASDVLESEGTTTDADQKLDRQLPTFAKAASGQCRSIHTTDIGPFPFQARPRYRRRRAQRTGT
jgi:hypothetical protein